MMDTVKWYFGREWAMDLIGAGKDIAEKESHDEKSIVINEET